MSRLTYKLDEPIKTKYLNYEYNRIKDYDIDRCNFGRITDDMIFNKLGRLEDIEEELGIDLITLFKALRNGIWTNQEQWYGDEKQGKIRFFQVRLLLEENAVGCIYNSMWKGEEVIRTLYFKDYGKTWSLDKQTLEK